VGEETAEFVRVAALAEVKPGHGIVAEANGKTLAVFNVDGTIMRSTIPVVIEKAR
jgi:calcineurin-like phosphoesterase